MNSMAVSLNFLILSSVCSSCASTEFVSSLIIFFSTMISVYTFLCIEILMFSICTPDLGEHVYDCYIELSVW